MRAETKERMFAALEKSFRVAGAENLEQGMALCSRLFESLYRAFEPLKNR